MRQAEFRPAGLPPASREREEKMDQVVRRFVYAGAVAAASAFLLSSAAEADGALALGKCNAWGWSSSTTPLGASQKAMADCALHDAAGCKVVARDHGGCMDVATDQSASCGKVYWADEVTRREAETGSLGQCKSGDGKSCALVASKCDQGD
jgi:hypothetical protein